MAAHKNICTHSEVSIVGSSRILNRDGHAVVALTAFAEVISLEVEGSLGEAITISDILVWI